MTEGKLRKIVTIIQRGGKMEELGRPPHPAHPHLHSLIARTPAGEGPTK